jgi:hypothetical protein
MNEGYEVKLEGFYNLLKENFQWLLSKKRVENPSGTMHF